VVAGSWELQTEVETGGSTSCLCKLVVVRTEPVAAVEDRMEVPCETEVVAGEAAVLVIEEVGFHFVSAEG
jgi:hypothetical protein